MNIMLDSGFKVERVSPYPNGDVNVTFRGPEKDPGRIRHLEVFMTADEYRKFAAGDLELEVGASLKMPKTTLYRERDDLARAEQVDLKDVVQLSRLRISAYHGPLGIEASVQIDSLIRAGVKTGDWLVRTLGGRILVMSDSDFKAKYEPAPISAPPEVEFSPEDYRKLVTNSHGASAEVKVVEGDPPF